VEHPLHPGGTDRFGVRVVKEWTGCDDVGCYFTTTRDPSTSRASIGEMVEETNVVQVARLQLSTPANRKERLHQQKTNTMPACVSRSRARVGGELISPWQGRSERET